MGGVLAFRSEFPGRCERSGPHNMDVFKLAFETTVVGVLAFLWLGIAVDLVYPQFFAKIVPGALGKNDALLGVGILSLAYCIGSAIVPISSQLVNDEHWPVPEDGIRCQVFRDQEDRLDKIEKTGFPEHHIPSDGYESCHCSYWDRFLVLDKQSGQKTFTWQQFWMGLYSGDSREELEKKKEILTLFQLQESKVLNQEADKAERFRQLHERIVVLRGAVFSGSALFLTCFFGCIAPVQDQPSHWTRRLAGILLAFALLAFCLWNALEDLKSPNIFDLPVMEGLLGVITLFGGLLVYYGVKARPYLRKRVVLMAAFFAALSYGGWMWSEVIYDQQVISSYAVMESPTKP